MRTLETARGRCAYWKQPFGRCTHWKQPMADARTGKSPWQMRALETTHGRCTHWKQPKADAHTGKSPRQMHALAVCVQIHLHPPPAALLRSIHIRPAYAHGNQRHPMILVASVAVRGCPSTKCRVPNTCGQHWVVHPCSVQAAADVTLDFEGRCGPWVWQVLRHRLFHIRCRCSIWAFVHPRQRVECTSHIISRILAAGWKLFAFVPRPTYVQSKPRHHDPCPAEEATHHNHRGHKRAGALHDRTNHKRPQETTDCCTDGIEERDTHTSMPRVECVCGAHRQTDRHNRSRVCNCTVP